MGGGRRVDEAVPQREEMGWLVFWLRCKPAGALCLVLGNAGLESRAGIAVPGSVPNLWSLRTTCIGGADTAYGL